MGEQLYAWAKEKYSIERHNATRKQAFSNLCGAPAHLRVLPQDGGNGGVPSPHTEPAAGGIPCAV